MYLLYFVTHPCCSFASGTLSIFIFSTLPVGGLPALLQKSQSFVLLDQSKFYMSNRASPDAGV